MLVDKSAWLIAEAPEIGSHHGRTLMTILLGAGTIAFCRSNCWFWAEAAFRESFDPFQSVHTRYRPSCLVISK